MSTTARSRRVTIVGDGRAGGSFARALQQCDWNVETIHATTLVQSATPTALDPVELVLLTVPDGAIASVARSIRPLDGVVAHVSGATGLGALAPHARVGSIHPLMSLPDPEIGARRLLDDCTFAVDGDPLMSDVVTSLGGRAVAVDESLRSLYHATATVAANHLVAMCWQVERLAALVGVPADAYWALMATTLDNVADVGAHAALTGPAARGDWETIGRHLAALPTVADRHAYLAMSIESARLAGRDLPDHLIHETS